MGRPAYLCLLVVALHVCGVSWADEEPSRTDEAIPVPDVRGLDAPDAVRVLLEAGLEPGRLFEKATTPSRAEGTVVQQAPPPDAVDRPSRRPQGSKVHLRVAAAADGPAAGREVPAAWRKARAASDALPPARVDVVRKGEPPSPPTPAPPAPRVLEPAAAVGSPDGDPVPALEGLELVEAEQLCRSRGLELHVERVAGHPVGRILVQAPAPGAPRPQDGWVRVQVTAGGDRPASVAPAPTLALTRLAVPDLLDRTWPQAERILADLGFVGRREEALRGPPGRIADQRPPPGAPLERGGTVVVHIAPAHAARPPEGPRPIAPRPGVDLGSAATVLVGFAWHPFPGAERYVLEIEEADAPGGWVALVRQVVRRTGALVEVERLGRPPGALRWRVSAVAAGRPEVRSAWLELR